MNFVQKFPLCVSRLFCHLFTLKSLIRLHHKQIQSSDAAGNIIYKQQRRQSMRQNKFDTTERNDNNF